MSIEDALLGKGRLYAIVLSAEPPPQNVPLLVEEYVLTVEVLANVFRHTVNDADAMLIYSERRTSNYFT